jgi:uncharacterized protein
MVCFFASDLHGRTRRYKALFRKILEERPRIVFLGGDLLPPFGNFSSQYDSFLNGFLLPELQELQRNLGADYPRILFIFGNDDPGAQEEPARELEKEGLWIYIHNRWIEIDGHAICGYAYVPPTPFRLKDWERYDVSRYVDPGCIAPSEGVRTVQVPPQVLNYATIQQDLQTLTEGKELTRAILLFHGPPYETNLDRAGLDGKKVDHVPLDVHVGSIAVRRFIERQQPMLTLHGHIHESARITGSWRDRIGGTHLFSAAYDGPELALVRFDPADLDQATREII